MSKTYKELIQGMAHGHRFKSTEKICEECNIPINSYYKVTNPNKTQTNGAPVNTPLEWVAPLTRATGNYGLVEQVCKDVGGMFIAPDVIQEIRNNGEGLLEALEKFFRIIGRRA